MKLTLSATIPAPVERVFAALTDPDVLRRAIPGCEELTANGADTYAARLKIGLAGVKGTYSGTASIRDRRPPESLTLGFDGKGGPGFVRGAAAVRLNVEEDRTHVVCDADVQVGGLIAAVGSRLIEAAARKLTGDFFHQVAIEIGARAGVPGH